MRPPRLRFTSRKVAFPLYFDDDSQGRAVIRTLRERSVECHTTAEEGMEGSSDSAHLAFAAEHGWCVVTRNEDDFLRLHAEYSRCGEPHAGIVVVHQWRRMSIGDQIRAMWAMQEALAAVDMRTSVAYLSRWVPPAG